MKKLVILFAIVVTCDMVNAQITNSGFETWTTAGGYSVPTGWDNINSMTSATSTYTCEKGTPGTVGSSYMKLTSRTVTGMGILPGVSVNGILNTVTFAAKSGSPSTIRPSNLTGSWQFMGFSGDEGYISILLSKWNTATNSRDTVAYSNRILSGMVMSWATFSIPLTYHSSVIPDSAIIMLSASGSTPANNSYLYVDNLSFTGTVPTGVPTIADIAPSISVFPNPSFGTITISYNSTSVGDVEIHVNNISAKSMFRVKNKTVVGENNFLIDVSGFPNGIYTVKLVDGLNTQLKKIIIQ